MPNTFWKETLSDFGDMEFRRKTGGYIYDDADEAAEEPVWQSHIHLKPVIEHEEICKNKLGVRQVKNLVKREAHRPRPGSFWDILASSQGETRALPTSAKLGQAG